MPLVDTMEGIRYGFQLMKYFAGVVIVAAVVIGIAFFLFQLGNIFALFGVLLFIAGFLMAYAGVMGVLYKVIADAVHYANTQA